MSSYAFQSAAGYNQLQGQAWSPQIFSKKVMKVFRKKTVVDAITNSDYFGEIKNQGDSVRIIKEPNVDVKRLYRGTQLVRQDLTDEDFILTVDRALYFMFAIDDIEKMQSHVNWMDMAASRAAYNMSEEYDSDILGYMSGFERNIDTGVWTARSTAVGTKAWEDADSDELLGIHKLTRASFVTGGSSSESVSVGVSGTYDVTPLTILNRFNRLLDEQNVPKDGRYVVIDPVFAEKLMDENSKLVNNDYAANQNAGGQLENGKLIAQKLRGFDVYESNSLPKIGGGPGTIDSNGSSTDYGVIVAGQKDGVATAQQLTKTETYRAQDGFADVTRGMQVYGRKILRPESMLRCLWNIAN